MSETRSILAVACAIVIVGIIGIVIDSKNKSFDSSFDQLKHGSWKSEVIFIRVSDGCHFVLKGDTLILYQDAHGHQVCLPPQN